MKWIRNFVMCLVLMAIVGACLKQPEYSIVPAITFNDLYFRPGNLTNGIPDSLIIKFDFKDGDGDLGIGAEDSSSLDFFSPWYYLYDASTFDIYYTNDRFTALPNGYEWINYSARKNSQVVNAMKAANIFTGSNFPDINCTNWEQISGDAGVTDTLFITQNDKAFNINVDLEVKNTTTGEYELFDPATYFAFPGCNPNLFRGTFKNLSSDRGKSAPIEGTFRYNIQSAALKLLFSNKTLKLKVYIKDRAFHTSDTLIRKDFTLASITRGG